MKWKGTVDAVLGLRRLAEKSKSKNKMLLVFVDLGKSFDQGPSSLFCLETEVCLRVFERWTYVAAQGL